MQESQFIRARIATTATGRETGTHDNESDDQDGVARHVSGEEEFGVAVEGSSTSPRLELVRSPPTCTLLFQRNLPTI